MPWNLVDALSDSVLPHERRFYLPLASIPPGRTTTRNVMPGQFETSDVVNDPNDPVFQVRISPLPSGFSDEENLPDPAIRFHALAPGKLFFKPADAEMGDRLILEMPSFLAIDETRAPWWRRWVEAGCWPHELIYENVDRDVLENLLQQLLPSIPFFGLSFPPEVLLTDTSSFIDSFFAGNNEVFFNVDAGAVLGAAATDTNDATKKTVRFHARYRGHSVAAPHPMHPRELLALVFGDESNEARAHPLLQSMEHFARTDSIQLALEPGTRRMLLRPPLRTWQRVVWEAELEEAEHPSKWKPSQSLGTDRFFNDHARETRSFNDGNYTGSFKCNLFVCDVCLRAGFRAVIHPVLANRWHYASAGQYANKVHNLTQQNDRDALRGTIAGTATPWGWKIEAWVRAIAPEQRQASLNRAMWEEGRCLILAGGRAAGHSGHIVIVTEVHTQPDFLPIAQTGEGLNEIRISTKEARQAGAKGRPDENSTDGPGQPFGLAGTGGAADSTHNFIRLHLFELHPGEDPDTSRGLRNCNVQI